MKVLITGGNGFIGNHLVEKLAGSAEIFIYDREYPHFPKDKVDYVYHLAANSRAYACVKNPNLAIENIEVTKKVLDWMVKTKTKKLIFTSSREAFDLQNTYGASKVACEALIEAYSNMYDIGAVSLRLPNIYGSGDHEDRFIPKAMVAIWEEGGVYIYGGETKLLNFVHVSDCVDILVEALNMVAVGKHYWLEIANPYSVSLYEVVKLIKKVLGKDKIEIYDLPVRRGEVDAYVPRNPLPWKFKYDLESGIRTCL